MIAINTMKKAASANALTKWERIESHGKDYYSKKRNKASTQSKSALITSQKQKNSNGAIF